MRKLSGEEIMKGIARAKFSWVDQQFKKILPRRIYQGMLSPATHERCCGWLEEHGYRVMEDNEGVVKIMKGVKQLASVKITFELNSLEELNQLAKVCRVKYPGQA